MFCGLTGCPAGDRADTACSALRCLALKFADEASAGNSSPSLSTAGCERWLAEDRCDTATATTHPFRQSAIHDLPRDGTFPSTARSRTCERTAFFFRRERWEGVVSGVQRGLRWYLVSVATPTNVSYTHAHLRETYICTLTINPNTQQSNARTCRLPRIWTSSTSSRLVYRLPCRAIL